MAIFILIFHLSKFDIVGKIKTVEFEFADNSLSHLHYRPCILQSTRILVDHQNFYRSYAYK